MPTLPDCSFSPLMAPTPASSEPGPFFKNTDMDHKFTQRIKAWLDTPSSGRDHAEGALLLLKLSGNRLLYANVMRKLPASADIIEYQLQKYYDFRVRDLTREQVAELSARAEEAVERHISISVRADTAPRRGKREDHDLLPEEIQRLWTDNMEMTRRMREVHLRLRMVSLQESPCHDSERYPFVKELVQLDKKMVANYGRYDSYPPQNR